VYLGLFQIENQIMSENDREDIPADVVPLPERPARYVVSLVCNKLEYMFSGKVLESIVAKD
jgi:hypothetical protein